MRDHAAVMNPVTAGTYILHYRLLEPLGAGGMGVVWKALDTRLEREVALKFVHADGTPNPVSQERFAREARLASGLNHPNIITIHDINFVDDRPFIVMELLRGQSLRHILDRGRTPVPEAVGWALQIADALGQAHAAGIVHRDLKPSNVMVGPQGQVKVLDFGLAKVVGQGVLGPEDETRGIDLTLPGRAVGTVGYQSPEQAMGGTVDARSDVFTFGILLYEMFSGTLPFPGKSWEEFATGLLHRTPPPLRETCPDLPGAVAAVVERCLSRDIQVRYADCGEVYRDLRWRVSGSLDGSRLLTRTETLPLSVPFIQRPLVKLVGAVALVAALSAGVWMYLHPLHRQRGLAVLPFTAVSTDARTQALSLGLLTTLSGDLSSVGPFEKAFWVVPASDVLQMKAQSTKDARQSFAVDMAITGSIETDGGKVKVTISLVDAGTQQTLRSRSFIASSSAPFALEDQLLGKAAELLQIDLPESARASLRASGSAEPDADDLYLQALGYLDGGNDKADAAIDVLNQALAKDPEFAKAHAGLAEAYRKKYSFTKDPVWMAKAHASSAEALRLNPQLPEARRAVAAIATQEGHYDEAIGTLRQIIGQDSANRMAWSLLGQALESKQDNAGAESAYRRAVELQPGSPIVYQSIGVFYYKVGRYPEAEKSFLRQRELAPDNFRVYSLLGALYVEQGRQSEAETVLKRSITLKPSAIAYNNLGSVYTYLGRPKDAVPMMEQAVAMGQKSVPLLGNLARAYRDAGMGAKAGPVAQQAIDLALKQLAINPKDAETMAELAWIHAETNDAASARKELNTALQLAPANGAVLLRAVLVNELTGDRDRAIAALDSLAKTGTYLQEVQRQPELKALRDDARYKQKEKAWQTIR